MQDSTGESNRFWNDLLWLLAFLVFVFLGVALYFYRKEEKEQKKKMMMMIAGLEPNPPPTSLVPLEFLEAASATPQRALCADWLIAGQRGDTTRPLPLITEGFPGLEPDDPALTSGGVQLIPVPPGVARAADGFCWPFPPPPPPPIQREPPTPPAPTTSSPPKLMRRSTL